MSRRVPIFATIIVLAAVATMIGLGVWQLGRAEERDQQIASLEKRVLQPALMFPQLGLTTDDYLYRTLTADCTKVLSWETAGGKDINGRTGWSKIANCVDESSASNFKADVGIGLAPEAYPDWNGGKVTGRAVLEEDDRSLIELITRVERPKKLKIVSVASADDLIPSKQPDPSEERNSSWAYAGQWFFFALTALVIYVLALRRRQR
jgi:surfeit locus 1 family protein